MGGLQKVCGKVELMYEFISVQKFWNSCTFLTVCIIYKLSADLSSLWTSLALPLISWAFQLQPGSTSSTLPWNSPCSAVALGVSFLQLPRRQKLLHIDEHFVSSRAKHHVQVTTSVCFGGRVTVMWTGLCTGAHCGVMWLLGVGRHHWELWPSC